MSYKVVRSTGGDTVCFGPNTEQYDPVIPAGAVLTIEPTIPDKTQSELNAETSAKAKSELAKIDRDSIRLIREYIAAKPDAPQGLKNLEGAAAAERVKVRV